MTRADCAVKLVSGLKVAGTVGLPELTSYEI